MMTKQLFSTLRVLLMTGFLFAANQSFAQTRQYATTVDAYHTPLGTADAARPRTLAVDGANSSDLTTAARTYTITVANPIGILPLEDNGYIELKFPAVGSVADVPANTTVYVKIDMQQAEQLQALVGGGLGSLLNNLLGQQAIEVSAKNNAGTTVFDASSNFAQERLRIVRDRLGSYYVKVTPNAAFNRIRLTNRINGLLATRWLDVYGAFYVNGNTGCALGAFTSYSAFSIASLSVTNPEGVTNPQRAIDGDAVLTQPSAWATFL